MSKSYVIEASKDFYPEKNDDIMDSLFEQYEKVIIRSIITSFGLDFFIKDQHGGDVDTINNVRQIGIDNQMIYKNKSNQSNYENRPEYDKDMSRIYHQDKNYISRNREISRQKKEGILNDAYTNKKVARNADIDLDHVISAKEIHDDRGRVLAGLSGCKLANSEENLQPTDRSINRSMGKKDIKEYTKYLEDTREERQKQIAILKSKNQLTDKERKQLNKYEKLEEVDIEQMKKIDSQSRKSYEAKLASAYYTSPNFRKDVAFAAGTIGLKMGIRETLGFVFTEIWFCVKDEFSKIGQPFSFGELLNAIGNGIKHGVENAKEKYKELLAKFKDGALAGALSSITTTICNIFFTTAKNVVKLIRQVYPSLVEAAKVLFLNPDNFGFGDRIRAVLKILATGASVIVGTVVTEAINKTPIVTIPVVNKIVPTFCGTFVTGIMTCSLLYFFDRSEIMNKLVNWLNKINTLSAEVEYFRQQAIYFEMYAAKLMEIDLEKFKKETSMYNSFAQDIENITDEKELNRKLKEIMTLTGIKIPWEGEFDSFMSNKNNRLVFE